MGLTEWIIVGALTVGIAGSTLAARQGWGGGTKSFRAKSSRSGSRTHSRRYYNGRK